MITLYSVERATYTSYRQVTNIRGINFPAFYYIDNAPEGPRTYQIVDYNGGEPSINGIFIFANAQGSLYEPGISGRAYAYDRSTRTTRPVKYFRNQSNQWTAIFEEEVSNQSSNNRGPVLLIDRGKSPEIRDTSTKRILGNEKKYQ